MSDFKALFKHSSNYLFANMATKALSFISIPVYTRILSVEDYGIVSVFSATVGIASILLTLSTEVAIGRYYYEAKDEDDFKDFVGTSIRLTSLVILLMATIGVLLLPIIAETLSFNRLLTIALFPVALYSVINSIFTQIYGVLLQSKKIAIVSSVQTYLAFGLSVLFIFLLSSEKYYGQVLGTIVAMIILAQYLIRQIKPYYHHCFKRKYLKYILSYSLPYIPYSLSSVILVQFGRLIMSDSGGFQSAGLYSFAANVGALMMLFISITHSAWNPYYYRYMTDNDYESINKDYDLIWRVTLCGGLFLTIFGNDIGILLGREEFLGAMYILPYLILGYLFYQWAYVYLRNAGFARRVIWNAVAILSSGIINVYLSVWLADDYKELGIAIAFCSSYFVMLLVSWGINCWILKVYSPAFLSFAKPLLLCVGFQFVAIILPYSIPITILLFLSKIVLCILGCYWLMRQYMPILLNRILR